MERSASESYQTVRARLTKISNEDVNTGGSDRYICQVDTLDGRSLQSTNMCELFRQHFQKSFTKKPGLYAQEFHSNLAEFPRILSTEVAGYEVRS